MSLLNEMVVFSSIIIIILCSSIVFPLTTAVGFEAVSNKNLLQLYNINPRNNTDSYTQYVRQRVKREDKSGMARYAEMAKMTPDRILKLYLKLIISVLTRRDIGYKSVEPFASIFKGKINYYTKDIDE